MRWVCVVGCQCGRHKPKTAAFATMMAERNRSQRQRALAAGWHTGRKRPPETGARIAAKAIGRPSSFKGRRHSLESRALLRAARIGKPMAEATKRAISAATKGRPASHLRGKRQSAEHIAKRVAIQTGRHYNLPVGQCAICGLERRLYKDHCHESGRRRGMLCIRCNVGIGQLGDSPELLEIAAAYIRSHRGTS